MQNKSMYTVVKESFGSEIRKEPVTLWNLMDWDGDDYLPLHISYFFFSFPIEKGSHSLAQTGEQWHSHGSL